MLIYNFGYAMELIQDDLVKMMFWVRVQNLGIHLIGPSWLLFVLSLSGNERWIKPNRVAILYAMAFPFLITSQTLGGANLFHTNPRVNFSGGFPTFDYDRTWLNYLALAYYSLCIFSSIVLFTQMFFRFPHSFRSQIAIFGVASLLPWIGGSLYIFEITPANIDTTPLTLTLSLLIFLVGFYHFGMLDVLPLARDIIFEGMSEAALVLDHQNRILDFNTRLGRIFKEIKLSDVGTSAKELFKEYPALVRFMDDEVGEKMEFSITTENKESFYEAKRSNLFRVGHANAIGKAIILHDITPLKELMKKLEVLATIDSLTQIYNRYSFQELAEAEIYRVERYGGELSLIILDLDHFKLINDQYGHPAGDATLVHVAQLCRRLSRQSDLIARLGGEEFAILLPETSLLDAICAAEKLRAALEQTPVEYEGQRFSVTASFGVSSWKPPERSTFLDLLKAADRALYVAKQDGRNQVWAK